MRFPSLDRAPTPRMWDYVRAVVETGDVDAVAKAFCVSPRTVHDALQGVYASLPWQGRRWNATLAVRAKGMEVLTVDGEERAAMREAVKSFVTLVETMCDGVRSDRQTVSAHVERASDMLARAARILGSDAVSDLRRRLVEAEARMTR